MEPERLEPTLAERLEASAELFSEAKAAKALTDEPTLTTESRKQALRERVSELRKRLVIKRTTTSLVAIKEPLTTSRAPRIDPSFRRSRPERRNVATMPPRSS